MRLLKGKQITGIIVISVLIVGIGVGVYLVQRQQIIKSKASEGRLPKAVDRGPLSKMTFIHYRKGAAKPAPDATKGSSGSCYSYIAGGAKWQAPADYIVDPTGSSLDSTYVGQTISKAVSEWEKYGGPNIFGVGYTDPNYPYIGAYNDGNNVVTFGPYSDNNAIAVTTVWGHFSGDPATRDIVEWDALFNNYYRFGDAAINGSAAMDLQEIATHELGHSAGMGDLYSASCSTETMYGYSGYGEIIKRDLSTGDIQGIKKLYR